MPAAFPQETRLFPPGKRHMPFPVFLYVLCNRELYLEHVRRYAVGKACVVAVRAADRYVDRQVRIRLARQVCEARAYGIQRGNAAGRYVKQSEVSAAHAQIQLVLFRRCGCAVSYTHLDVYKRQPFPPMYRR